MLRFHPTTPAIPPTVLGLRDRGLLRVDMTSVGGDIDEYELTVQDALRLAQRLRDAAMSMHEFLTTKPKGTSP